MAYEAIKEAIEKHGETPPASNHIPANIKAVKRETWDLYAEPRFEAMYKSNVRASRMKTAIDGLIGKRIGTWDGWLWLYS